MLIHTLGTRMTYEAPAKSPTSLDINPDEIGVFLIFSGSLPISTKYIIFTKFEPAKNSSGVNYYLPHQKAVIF